MEHRREDRFEIRAAAPMRICDIGGWTDTWFAGHGAVFNVAVSPEVEVHVEVHGAEDGPDRVVLHVETFGERYSFEPGRGPGRHPLLEAVIEEIGVPDDTSVVIRVASQVPPGCSTGTSASTAVALIGALDALVPPRMTPQAVAECAHRIEVERLGLQSGVQDQVCASFGGINYIEVGSYPEGVSRSSVVLPESTWRELERRLLLVYLGSAHASSEMHDRVIDRLVQEGQDSPSLEHLRQCARAARDAAESGDLDELGRLMTENTEAQERLHEDLVSAPARTAIAVAAARGAAGWKVNGAGGEGGSLTILCADDDPERRRGLEDALLEAEPLFRIIPIRLSKDGLRVERFPA
jgi:D-glycero-alpha-D-manno-heptose-7-phosphate kinase